MLVEDCPPLHVASWATRDEMTKIQMPAGNCEGVGTTQSHCCECATTVWRCNSDYCVVGLHHPSLHCAHELTVGNSNVVPGSRIFTKGWSGWF